LSGQVVKSGPQLYEELKAEQQQNASIDEHAKEHELASLLETYFR